MSRPSCKFPDDCTGPKSGVCRRCQPESVKALAEAMRKRNADPEFARANAERAAEKIRKLNADPEFAKANAERMRQRHSDPEFAKANAERMRKLHADPEFAKAHAERAAERMRKRNADPEFARANAERAAERMRQRHAEKLHLIGVPDGAEATFRLARKNGFSKKEAIRIAISSMKEAAQ